MNTHPGALKVSVIIPLYNKGPYIARALDSVLAQTIQEFEIIIVDGGSTDESLDVAARYTDPRITCFRQEGKGVSRARNQGVKRARAELIAFLDADDRWYPDFLETVLCLREKFPEAGMYGTGYAAIDAKKRIMLKSYKHGRGPCLINSYFSLTNNHQGMLILIITSAMMIPKSVFEAAGGFPTDYKHSEDRALIGKIALSYPVAYDSSICANYYIGTLNNSSHLTEFLRDPFSDYLTTLPIPELINRSDYSDVILYADTASLYLSLKNIYSLQNKIEIKNMLNAISSPSCQRKKRQYLLLLKMPCFYLRIRRIISQLAVELYHKWKYNHNTEVISYT